MNNCENPGGATLWARQTTESDIFYWKPDKWFKIWFYLVNRVNYKDTKQFKRGECFLNYKNIMDATNATKDQVKHCMEFLKQASMIATQKSTRGMIIKVLKYDHFQTLDNYYYDNKSHTKSQIKATQKPHRSHTIVEERKNDKNDKNIYISIAEASSAEVIPDLLKDKQKHIRIIGLYARAKKINFTSKTHQNSFISRNLRASKNIVSYETQRIMEVMSYLVKNADFKWTLESVGKYIDEDLQTLTINKKNSFTVV